MSPLIFNRKDTIEELPMSGILGSMPRILWAMFSFSREGEEKSRASQAAVSPEALNSALGPPPSQFTAPLHFVIMNVEHTYTHTHTQAQTHAL